MYKYPTIDKKGNITYFTDYYCKKCDKVFFTKKSDEKISINKKCDNCIKKIKKKKKKSKFTG